MLLDDLCSSRTRSRRRSLVSGGIARRMSLPSFAGLMPRSDRRMAFSMAAICDTSQGWIVMVVEFGVASVAIWFRGVGVP